MTVTELNKEQLTELKQAYLTNHMLEVEDREPSYGELAEADDIVPDELVFEYYDGTVFSNDDFACTAGADLF